MWETFNKTLGTRKVLSNFDTEIKKNIHYLYKSKPKHEI